MRVHKLRDCRKLDVGSTQKWGRASNRCWHICKASVSGNTKKGACELLILELDLLCKYFPPGDILVRRVLSLSLFQILWIFCTLNCFVRIYTKVGPELYLCSPLGVSGVVKHRSTSFSVFPKPSLNTHTHLNRCCQPENIIARGGGGER